MLITSLSIPTLSYPFSSYFSPYPKLIISTCPPTPAVLFTSEQRALLNDALGYFDETVREASAKEGDTDPIAAARYIH